MGFYEIIILAKIILRNQRKSLVRCSDMTKENESLFGLAPLKYPLVLVSSPLSSKWDLKNFKRDLSDLLPKSISGQFENIEFRHDLPPVFFKKADDKPTS